MVAPRMGARERPARGGTRRTQAGGGIRRRARGEQITHGQGMAGEVAYMGLYDVLRDVS